MKNLKTINSSLHKKLFGSRRMQAPYVVETAVENILREFDLHELQDPTDPIELDVPSDTICTHDFFKVAAEHFLTPYRQNLLNLCNFDSSSVRHELVNPCVPIGGWCRYTSRGLWERVDMPPGDSAYCLDFETVEHEPGRPWLPTCAVALRVLSDQGTELYVWRQDFLNPVMLVPFSGGNVITGWNVTAYDRAYLLCEYGVKPSGNVFPDLMSLHIKNRGICNQQVGLLKVAEKARESGEYDPEDYIPEWTYETSSNGLAAAYKLYTGGTVDKGVRDEILELGYMWVMDNMPKVIQYCITDVLKTMELWAHVYPEYSGYPDEDVMIYSRHPSPVSVAGMLIKSTSFIPLSPERWHSYYENAEKVFNKRNSEIKDLLTRCYVRVLEQYNSVRKEVLTVCRHVSQMKQCKVSTKPKSAYMRHIRTLEDMGYEYSPNLGSQVLQVFHEHIDPWASQIFQLKKLPAQSDLSLTMLITPLLLKLLWKGLPVRYTEVKGWHTDEEQVPHPVESDKVNRCLFSKDMKGWYEDGTITSADEAGLTELMVLFNSTVNWRSMRKRVALIKTHEVDGTPYMVLDALQHGTQTGREASKTLHVFPHTKPADPAKGKLDAVGTSFMSLIQALPEYDLLSIDFDSQELVLFMLAGCEALGYVGSTPLSIMVLCGQASEGTDFHSMTMKLTGITNRTLAKNLNYAGCYNSGRATQIKTMLKGNPELGYEVAKEMEAKWRESFVGKWTPSGLEGGTASESFNILRRRADAPVLTTLFGDCKLSRAISGNKDFMTTRFNAVIQSTGAVMLDHILVGTNYLSNKYNIDTRYAFNRHDEWVYHTHQSQRMEMAYLMQLVHMFTWVELVWQMGLDTLPLNLAYASSVQASKNYLKSPTACTVTEDHPYQCPPAVSITKQDIRHWLDTQTTLALQ